MDIGKKYVQACLLDEDGLEDISLLLNPSDMAVLGSTGNLWVWIYDLLRDMDVRVKLANPLKTRAIASAKIKSDKIDARILAYLLKSDLIPESYVPEKLLIIVIEFSTNSSCEVLLTWLITIILVL